MLAKPGTILIAVSLTMTACHDDRQPAAPEPRAAATAKPPYTPPTPALTAVPSPAPTVSVLPAATACGAEKLQNYLNLLPTSTAKDEIARTLGHNRVRYVSLAQEKAEATPGSARVTAGLGVDGRIKEFACG